MSGTTKVIPIKYVKIQELILRLTKALKAGRWAAISYIQHPGQQGTI